MERGRGADLLQKQKKDRKKTQNKVRYMKKRANILFKRCEVADLIIL